MASTLLLEPAEYESAQYAAILEEKAEGVKQGLIASMRTLVEARKA